MAVTITVAELLAAMRLGSSAEETAQAIRLLGYSTAAIEKHAPDAPAAIQNEAVVRLAGYLFEQPYAGQGLAFANSLRNSGASSMLLPYRVHRAGTTADAIATTTPGAGLSEERVLELIAQSGGGSSSYRGAWSALSADQTAALQIGDSVLHSGRFWRAHIIATARTTEPGAASAVQSDGWHAQPPNFRGVAPSSERHYDPLDVATDLTGDHFLCLTEGAYNLSEVIAGPNWAALGGASSGVSLSTVEGLINLERASTIAQVPSIVAAGVADWAETSDTTVIPALKVRAATQAERGAVSAAVNDDIDESPGSRQTTILGYTVNALKRLVNRIVPAWARTGDTTAIPADKLTNAPGASGGLNESAVDARVATLVEDWAEVGDSTQIPTNKLDNAAAASGSGLNQNAVDARVAALVSDWAELSDTTTVIPVGRYRPVTVAASLPAPNAALGSQLYGTGSSHADRVYWPKRIADRKTVTLRAAFLTEARGDAAIVGWQASPEIGRVRPPWGVLLGVTRFVIEPSGGGSSWRISMSGGSGLAHPTGIIITGIGTQTITLFRRAGSPNSAPIYDSANTSTTRQFVAGATYSIKIRYSGGQNFFNVHDSDYLEGFASQEDLYDLNAKIEGIVSDVASLAAASVAAGSHLRLETIAYCQFRITNPIVEYFNEWIPEGAGYTFFRENNIGGRSLGERYLEFSVTGRTDASAPTDVAYKNALLTWPLSLSDYPYVAGSHDSLTPSDRHPGAPPDSVHTTYLGRNVTMLGNGFVELISHVPEIAGNVPAIDNVIGRVPVDMTLQGGSAAGANVPEFAVAGFHNGALRSAIFKAGRAAAGGGFRIPQVGSEGVKTDTTSGSTTYRVRLKLWVHNS